MEDYIFILLAIGYYVFRFFLKNKSKTKEANPRQKKKKKSFFDTVLQEMKQMQEKPKKTPKAKPVETNKSKPLDWQQVDYTRFKDTTLERKAPEKVTKKSSSQKEIIKDSEIGVYSFDVNEIDWKEAIITKEILGRKFS